MNTHFDVDEVPCPNCGGTGGWWGDTRDDWNGNLEDNWVICHRCQGAGTILIKIKKEKVEEDV